MTEQKKIFEQTELNEIEQGTKNSIFSYRTQIDYSSPEYKTASEKTVKELSVSGRIGAREKLICRFLYELGEMTSHQIEMAFAHPFIDPELIKVSATGANPYLNEINTLETYGVVKVSRFTVRNKPSIKVYGLTKAAASWFSKDMVDGRRYYDMSKEYCFKYPCETCIEELDHLSSISYFIKEICSNLNLLDEFYPVYFEGVNQFRGYYRYCDRGKVLLMSIRDPEKEYKKALNALNASILSNPKNHLLFLTPDVGIMQDLRDKLKTVNTYSDSKCLYTTDIQAMTEDGSPVIFRFSDKGQTMLLSTNELRYKEE